MRIVDLGTQYEKLFISNEMTIRDVMKVIDEGACKTAFWEQDGILKGSVTDGDVRRYLLKNGNITDSVSNIINTNPIKLYINDDVDYQKFMNAHLITALPIVDDSGHIVRIETLKLSEKKVELIKEQVPVVMMAGGEGTRLKPFTDIIPKPLIPIGEKTITEHIFDRFQKYNCNDFYMIINYKKNLIKAYFAENTVYENLKFVEEQSFLGTAGGLGLLKDLLKDDFFLVNCDILVDCDYYSLWEKHKYDNNIITMVLARKDYVVPYGAALVNEEGFVENLIEKPNVTYYVNTGMYLCNYRIFKYVKEGAKIDMPDLILKCIQSGERVGQVTIDNSCWLDMGQPRELEIMKKQFGF